MRLIQTPAELEALVARLGREPLLAVDTEAASFHRYHDRVYLLQVSSRSETAVVDPLATGGLGPIGELLADPAIEIVFHDADYDLRLLQREYGYTVDDRKVQIINCRMQAVGQVVKAPLAPRQVDGTLDGARIGGHAVKVAEGVLFA